MLYLLGQEHRIVGISGFTVRPPRARKEKPKVSAFIDADIAKIESLKPDLILAFSDIQADITRELVSRGHSVVTFNQRSIHEILNAIVLIGSLVGQQKEAESLAKSLAENLKGIANRSGKQSHKPRVYFEEWPDPMITGIAWVSELIELVGGIDIFADLRGGGLAKERIISSQEVIERKPDVIIGSWCGKKVKKDMIHNRDGWEVIPAIIHGRVFEVNSSIILQPGPAALTDGVLAVERIVSEVRSEMIF